jgi:Pili and flagellar-assembly chaperone, PapD N-terminal domain
VVTHATVSEDRSQGTSSADWSSTYSNFLSRASGQAAATLELYQQALIRVAEGKLEPTVFQTHLPKFIQSHGNLYTNRLSEVGSRFLSRLVDLSSSYSRQGVESPAFNEPELAPPRFESENPMRWFEQLAEYAGKLNNRALKAYREQLDQVAAGEKTPAQVQQNTVDYLSNRFPHLMQKMTALYFDLLNGLNDVRASYEKDYFQSVLALADKPGRIPPVVVDLAAPRGEVASASLSVTNTAAEPCTVIFRFTDARRVDGSGPAFAPDLDITPPVLELAPGEEQKFRISLRIDPARYQEGAVYNSTLFISGGEALRVEVNLRIVATPATHAVNAPSSEA